MIIAWYKPVILLLCACCSKCIWSSRKRSLDSIDDVIRLPVIVPDVEFTSSTVVLSGSPLYFNKYSKYN